MGNPTTALVRAAWLEISADVNLRDVWLCDETIHRRIRALHPTLNTNRTAIDRALVSVAKSKHQLNVLGLFHVSFRTICPYSNQCRTVHYYYRHVLVKPSFPRQASDVEDIFAKSFRLVEERAIATRDCSKKANNDETDNGKSKKN